MQKYGSALVFTNFEPAFGMVLNKAENVQCFTRKPLKYRAEIKQASILKPHNKPVDPEYIKAELKKFQLQE